MTDMKINGVAPGGSISPLRPADKEPASVFDNVMKEAMEKLTQVQNDADKAVQELAAGGDVTQAVVSLEKADMNFQLMVEVRNKLLTAYQDIMKMPV